MALGRDRPSMSAGALGVRWRPMPGVADYLIDRLRAAGTRAPFGLPARANFGRSQVRTGPAIRSGRPPARSSLRLDMEPRPVYSGLQLN